MRQKARALFHLQKLCHEAHISPASALCCRGTGALTRTHSSGPLGNVQRSPCSQTPPTLEICRTFHSQQVSQSDSTPGRTSGDGSCSPVLHTDQQGPDRCLQKSTVNEKNKWIDLSVYGGRGGGSSEWTGEWVVSESGNEETHWARGYPRCPGGMVARSAPGKPQHSLQKHFLFPWQAWSALWKDAERSEWETNRHIVPCS